MTTTGGGPIRCPNCGTPAVPGARFCFSCGSPLTMSELDLAPEAGGERRVVTVLFGDLSDFTAWAEELDPERVKAVTDRLLATLSAAVAETGGHVDKLTGDGIMAVFGAPTAHEDDPQRAVRAAAAMQQAARRVVAQESGGGRALGLRVGLNTGEVLAGVQAGLSYTVVGDTVNTAARLSDAAGVGAVWAGRETATATMSIASWRALRPMRLKGKRDPVQVYELVRLRAQPTERAGLGDEAPFIGRDAERGLLVTRLLDVIDRRHPASVVVTGEAGVGKSRLAVELARFTTEIEGSRILWGRCAPYGEGRELRPLADWVRTACGITVAELGDDVEMAARVRRTVTRLQSSYDGTIALEPLLALAGLPDRDPASPRETLAPGASAVREPTVNAVAALLSALAAGGPLLLILDDLQWATPELLDTVVGLTGRLTGPTLLVAVGRSEMLTPERRADWWQRLPGPELLPLVPLEPATSERLLTAYLGGSELDPPVRATLLERAEGNPFFLAELLHLLIDRGLLRRDGTEWRLVGDLPEDVLPAGVQAVLAARFDGLAPVARAVLRSAAVIGSTFPDAGVVAVAATAGDFGRADPAEAVAQGLRVLRDRDIVRSRTSGVHSFVHTLARDAAYAGVPKVERARRHAAVCHWAASALPGPAAEVDAFVGAHAERALALATEMGLPPADAAWSVRTAGFTAFARIGNAAIHGEDPGVAADAFARALAIADDSVAPQVIARAHLGRAAGLLFRQRLAEAEGEISDLLTWDDPAVRAGALLVLGDIRRRSGEDTAAGTLLTDALSLAEEAGDDVTAGAALRLLGLIAFQAGRMVAAEGRFAAALQVAERSGDRRGAGWALSHTAWSATTRGAYDVAEQALRRAAEVFAELDDNRGLSWCAGSEAFVRLLSGRFNEARDLATGLLPLGERIGDQWGVGACLTIGAVALAELGDPEDAAEEAERARALFSDLGDTWGRAMATVAIGIAARCRGDVKTATDALAEAVAIAEGASYAALALLATVVAGYAHLDAGDLDPAAAAVERAEAITRGLELEPHATIGVEVLRAQVLRARGNAADALAILERIEARTDRPSLLFPRRQAVAHHAGALLELGRVDDADTVAAQAFDVPGEDVRSFVVALRVLAAVRVAQGRADDAAGALDYALQIARGAGYGTEIRLTEAALSRLAG